MCSCGSSSVFSFHPDIIVSGRWKMNGTEIKIEPDSRYRLNGGNLVITNPVKAKDAGSYQCIASNSMGTIISREAHIRFSCK